MNQLRKLQQSNLLRRLLCLQANRPASHPDSRSFHQLVNGQDDRRRNQQLVSVAVRSGLIQQQRRFKGKKAGKGKKADDDESDSESDSEEESDTDSSEEDSDTENSNIKKIETINTRLDMMMKHALSCPKHNVEQMLNEDKMRVNNERVTKKSQEVFINDVVDVISGLIDNNPERLRVTRCEFIDIDDKMNSRGKFGTKVKITKNIEVENYKDARFESFI